MDREGIPTDLRHAKREARRRYLRSSVAQSYTYAHSQKHAENITAVGIGRKVTAGATSDDLAVRIYVRSKLPKKLLGRRAVPERIDGISTDVVVSGPFRALGDGIAAAREHRRPVAPGISIGFAHSSRIVAGTLGALVTRNGTSFFLSNNHVLAFENKLPLGSPIVQPSMLDGGDLPTEKIGELAAFVPLTASGNRVDAALAGIAGATTSAQPFLHVHVTSSSPLFAVDGQRVHKIGRASGHTVGTVVDLAADIPVRFSSRVYRFDDQVLISGDTEPFALDGDSGALVVDMTAGRAVAMLFAGSNEFAAANHLADVFGALGVTLSV